MSSTELDGLGLLSGGDLREPVDEVLPVATPAASLIDGKGNGTSEAAADTKALLDAPLNGGCVREASWLARSCGRPRVNVARGGPEILFTRVSMRTRAVVVDSYIGSAGDGPGRDALLVLEHADRVILAVADGVTPTANTPRVGILDGAQHAAQTVLKHIGGAGQEADIRRPLLTANTVLLKQFGGRISNGSHPRDYPQAAVVAASIPTSRAASDQVAITRAGDCDAWIRAGERWTLKTPTPMLREKSRTALGRWDAAHPRATCAERIQEEMRVLTRSSWNVTPLGRFERPDIEHVTVASGFDAIALVTDGVEMHRFNGDPPVDPRDWLPDVDSSEPYAGPLGRRRDDVALLHLRFV